MKDHTTTDGMNRRSFLRSSAALGAGLAFAPRILAQSGGGASDQINVALLGAGAEGQVLMDACRKIPGIRFKAVCDIWEKFNLKRVSGLLRRYGHTNSKYTDYKEMLANKDKDKIDAVIIATPDFWHAEHAIACMKAGLDVYCEKEMSNELAKAKQMVQAQRDTGKLLQIGHQRRSNPRYLHCYNKLIKDAEICGRITAVNGQWNRAVAPLAVVPEKYAIPKETLAKYGFEDMVQFRNWRWYKGLGGGPMVDLGSHQIDIYNWFLQGTPKSVIASGGTDYYDKSTHEWYDTVMSIFEYQTPKGIARAYYQVLTTNSNQAYYETFMGDQGTLVISESPSRGSCYREAKNPDAPEWTKWVEKGYLSAPEEKKAETSGEAVLDVRETVAPPAYKIPVDMGGKAYHQPHLENFFNTMKGKDKLNCPGEIGYETAAIVLKVNEAVEAAKRLEFKPEDFHV